MIYNLWAEASVNLQLFKHYLIEHSGLAKDALHIYAGLLLFIGVRLVWRRRGGWVLGWLTALAVALLVERMDMRSEYMDANLQPDSAHWHDIWNTMFWPTVLLLVGPWLQPQPKPVAETSSDVVAEPSGDHANQRLEEPATI